MNPNQGQEEFQYSGAPQPPVGVPAEPVTPVAQPQPQAPTEHPLPPVDPQPQPEAAPEQPATQPSPEQLPETSELSDTDMVQWQASEFVDHQKNPAWFVLLFVGALVLCALMFLLTRSILSTVVVGVAIIAFGMVANQKPRTLTYSLLGGSIKIGDKSYSYDDFRSFSLVRDGALWSMILQPNKRFMPPLTMYFAPDDGERIFDALAAHLPHEDRQLDSVDRLMRRIRF